MLENTVDRGKPQKLYFQLLEILIDHIENDEWKVGSQIPTEDQLCSRYNVSKATVRLAVAELVSLGYLKKFQGRGTFVRRKKPCDRIPMLVNFGEENSSSHLIRLSESRTDVPCDEIRNYLALSEGNYCFFASRIIIVDGIPRVLQQIYVSCARIHPSALTLLQEEILNILSLHAFLESCCRTRIQRVKELTDISQIGEQGAPLLEIAVDSPVLRLRHVCYAQGDEPISYSESIYRTDGYGRSIEYERLKI